MLDVLQGVCFCIDVMQPNTRFQRKSSTHQGASQYRPALRSLLSFLSGYLFACVRYTVNHLIFVVRSFHPMSIYVKSSARGE